MNQSTSIQDAEALAAKIRLRHRRRKQDPPLVSVEAESGMKHHEWQSQVVRRRRSRGFATTQSRNSEQTIQEAREEQRLHSDPKAAVT